MATCVVFAAGVPGASGEAINVDGQYSCADPGAYIILTPTEINNANPFIASSDHYTAVTAIFGLVIVALTLIWGMKQILKIFNTHTES